MIHQRKFSKFKKIGDVRELTIDEKTKLLSQLSSNPSNGSFLCFIVLLFIVLIALVGSLVGIYYYFRNSNLQLSQQVLELGLEISMIPSGPAGGTGGTGPVGITLKNFL